MTCSKTVVCPDCLERLSLFGELCLEACLEACEGCTSGIYATYDVNKQTMITPIVEFMEQKKFLISTEISQTQIAFMPSCKGIFIDDKTIGYCWCQR